MLAVDGAVVSSVYRQLERLPADATHLVLSVGGNNALQVGGDVLRDEAETVWQGLAAVATVQQGFAAEYQALIRELRGLRKPLAICTIYDAIPGLSQAETAGVGLFNDVITRTAFKAQATLIDLRLICNEAADYSGLSPIEPSAVGGGKIMRAVAVALFDGAVLHPTGVAQMRFSAIVFIDSFCTEVLAEECSILRHCVAKLLY